MHEAAPSSLDSLPVVPVGGFFNGPESSSRRQCVLHSDHSLRRLIPPTMRFAHEVSELTIDRLFA